MIIISCNKQVVSNHFDDEQKTITALVFKALGDETRLALFRLIVKHPGICACELLDQSLIAQTTLSHHLKVLSNANLINVKKDGRWKHYSANPLMIKALINYINNLKEEK